MIFSISLFAQNLYFEAFKDIRQAKVIQNSNPKKAKQLFIEAYSYLKQLSNKSIKDNKPSSNVFYLLGEMYLYGEGIDKNTKIGLDFLCASSQLGNVRAKNLLKKLNKTCKKINFKELKQ